MLQPLRSLGLLLAVLPSHAFARETPIAPASTHQSASRSLLAGPLTKALERAQRKLERGIEVYRDHSRWEDPWKVATVHYEVWATGSQAQARHLAEGLEAMLPTFQSILDTDWAPSTPLKVFVLPDLQAYNDFGNTNGDARSSISSSFFAAGHPERVVATLPGRNETQLAMWATHAAAEQFLDGAFRRQPATWIAEGLGAYFSLYWAPDWGASEVARIQAEGSYVPWQELIGAPIERYGANAHERFMELGMLVSYFLHVRPETRIPAPGEPEPETSFASFLRDAVRGKSVDRHPFYTWFVANVVQLEQDFRALY